VIDQMPAQLLEVVAARIKELHDTQERFLDKALEQLEYGNHEAALNALSCAAAAKHEIERVIRRQVELLEGKR
jgi:hypothetical protein